MKLVYLVKLICKNILRIHYDCSCLINKDNKTSVVFLKVKKAMLNLEFFEVSNLVIFKTKVKIIDF